MLATFGHRASQFLEALLKDWAQAQVTQAVSLAQVTPLCHTPPPPRHTHTPNGCPSYSPTTPPSTQVARTSPLPRRVPKSPTPPSPPRHTHSKRLPKLLPNHPTICPSLPPHPAQACAQVTHPTLPSQTHTHSKRLPKLLPNHPTICPSRPHLTPAQACGQVSHPTVRLHPAQACAQVVRLTVVNGYLSAMGQGRPLWHIWAWYGRLGARSRASNGKVWNT